MKQVIDNFSAQSGNYAAFRPQSPAVIFDFVYSHVPRFAAAWDCGTGNGQVATRLAERFDHVYGTDISEQQLHLATPGANITYLKERAESTSLPDNSIDLVTIAQAIHWFDFDAFYSEVNRVARPGAIIAAWTYNVLRLTPEVNKVIDHLYMDITRQWWDPERRYVDASYTTIPFPFKELPAPNMQITHHWNADQLIGYLGTWSGVKNYIKQQGHDPVALVADDLRKAFGTSDKLEVNFPLNVRAGVVG